MANKAKTNTTTSAQAPATPVAPTSKYAGQVLAPTEKGASATGIRGLVAQAFKGGVNYEDGLATLMATIAQPRGKQLAGMQANKGQQGLRQFAQGYVVGMVRKGVLAVQA